MNAVSYMRWCVFAMVLGACGKDPGPADVGDESGTSDGDGAFVPIPDGGAQTYCNPGTQDCPTGQKCTAYAKVEGQCCVDAHKCVADEGTRELGEACTRTLDNDDCARGFFCLTRHSGESGTGVCQAFCDPEAAEPCSGKDMYGSDCVAFQRDGVLPLCGQLCEPLAQDCPPDQGCYPVRFEGWACSLPALGAGTGQDGEPCAQKEDCEAGLLCGDGRWIPDCATDRCCTPYCNYEAETDMGSAGGTTEDTVALPCSPPRHCDTYYLKPQWIIEGWEHVGWCRVPDPADMDG